MVCLDRSFGTCLFRQYVRAEGLVSKQGTSTSAGLAAGALAIIRQYYTAGFFPTGVPTPGNEILPSAALLKATAISGTQHLAGIRLVGDCSPVRPSFVVDICSTKQVSLAYVSQRSQKRTRTASNLSSSAAWAAPSRTETRGLDICS